MLRLVSILRWGAALTLVLLAIWGIGTEVRTSFLQSRLFSRLAHDMSFTLGSGSSAAIAFPKYGPYDERLGYAELPRFVASLQQHHFQIAQQARWSPLLRKFVEEGGYAVYHEKERAGLALYDRADALLYRATYPERTYPNFASIPPPVIQKIVAVNAARLYQIDLN